MYGPSKVLVYKQYFEGKITDSRLQMIDFDKVTIQPSDIFLSGRMLGDNLDSNFNESEQNDLIRKDLIQTFSGYMNKNREDFYKCFGMPLNERYFRKVDYLYLDFPLEKVLQSIHKNLKNIVLIIHYPNQLLLSSQFVTDIEIKPPFTWLKVDIRGTEIIQQRMKSKKCLTSWSNFDASVLERHVKEIGCRPPYFLSDNKSQVCGTKQEIERSAYALRSAREILFPPPCRRMTSVSFDTSALKRSKEIVTFKISFPKEIKIIRQTKAVNFQSFVGNVGGYIGLFLGKH